VSSSGEWRETKNREASQHRLSIRGLSFRAAEESLGRLSRSGPELLKRGSLQGPSKGSFDGEEMPLLTRGLNWQKDPSPLLLNGFERCLGGGRKQKGFTKTD